MDPTHEAGQDIWSKWLLHQRHGDDADFLTVIRSAVLAIADRVIDQANLQPGMTIIDVGAGEGVLGLRALERAGNRIEVLMTDISAPLLQHARRCAVAANLESQCKFLQCSAENLSDVADNSINAVMARASIAYVPNKAQAFQEFLRVLKPGGRLSIAEPILQDEAFTARALKAQVDRQALPYEDPFLPLLHRWKASQFPDTPEAHAQNPLVNFSERDLLNLVRQTGFVEIHLELHIDLTPSPVRTWGAFLEMSPHPWAAPLCDVLRDQFTPAERELFESVVRPMVESGQHSTVDRVAYLSATKPNGGADNGFVRARA